MNEILKKFNTRPRADTLVYNLLELISHSYLIINTSQCVKDSILFFTFFKSNVVKKIIACLQSLRKIAP